jgi:hypothetical protein
MTHCGKESYPKALLLTPAGTLEGHVNTPINLKKKEKP